MGVDGGEGSDTSVGWLACGNEVVDWAGGMRDHVVTL